MQNMLKKKKIEIKKKKKNTEIKSGWVGDKNVEYREN